MSAVNEEIKNLRAALSAATTELAVMKQEYGSDQQDKARKAQEQQRLNLENVIEQSSRELARLDDGVEQAIASLRAVAAGSAFEIANGFVSSREDAVLECRRLGGVIADLALARARKFHQHETLRTRLDGFAPPAPRKPTSFEPEYYQPSSEGEPPIEAA